MSAIRVAQLPFKPLDLGFSPTYLDSVMLNHV